MIDHNVLFFVLEIVIALGAASEVATFIKSWPERRKIVAQATRTDPEAVAALFASTIDLVESLRAAQIADLQARMRAAETRAVEAETRLRQLGEGS
jgi:predicted GNAT family acetyltransferase